MSIVARNGDAARLPPAHRRHDADLRALGHRSGEAAGEADALAAHEELHVLAHLARLGEHAIAHRWRFAPERVERVRHRVERARQLDRPARARQVAQDRGQAHAHRHRSPYRARADLRAGFRLAAGFAEALVRAETRAGFFAGFAPRACGTRALAGSPITAARTLSTGGSPSATSRH